MNSSETLRQPESNDVIISTKERVLLEKVGPGGEQMEWDKSGWIADVKVGIGINFTEFTGNVRNMLVTRTSPIQKIDIIQDGYRYKLQTESGSTYLITIIGNDEESEEAQKSIEKTIWNLYGLFGRKGARI